AASHGACQFASSNASEAVPGCDGRNRLGPLPTPGRVGAVRSVDPAVLAAAAMPRGKPGEYPPTPPPMPTDDEPGCRQITFISWQARANCSEHKGCNILRQCDLQ